MTLKNFGRTNISAYEIFNNKKYHFKLITKLEIKLIENIEPSCTHYNTYNTMHICKAFQSRTHESETLEDTTHYNTIQSEALKDTTHYNTIQSEVLKDIAHLFR